MKPPESQYASPEGDSSEEILEQFKSLNSHDFLRGLFNALPLFLTVLNEKRQVVFTNENLLHKFGIKELTFLLGKKPGEILKCIHAVETPAGCGNSPSCRVCGALNTILESISSGKKVVKECSIRASEENDQSAYDFEVTATPFPWNGENYIIFSMVDISSEKRRRILERIFFHDIINTAGNLAGFIELMGDDEPAGSNNKMYKIIRTLSGEIIEEINSQRVLLLAESGELKLNWKLLEVPALMETIKDEFAAGKKLKCEIKMEYTKDVLLYTDRTILARVLKNMLKNAIEASKENDIIFLRAENYSGYLRFSVNNPAFIPPDSQLQIFRRSFSTKGIDRGIGTYSMKILGEKYLGGKVSFKSTEKNGTFFYFDHPL